MGCCDAPGLMPIEDALNSMLSSVKPLENTQSCSVVDAIGRVISQDILSPMNVPPFHNSAMDGYAIRIEDIQTKATLPVVGKSFAGAPFTGQWPSQSCIRIMTGAQIPEGCDAVEMQENVTVVDQGVQFTPENIKSQQNIRHIGNDIATGDIVLSKGHRITPRDLPLLASLGLSHVEVVQKPKVAVFSTGDELKSFGDTLGEGDIYDSNRYAIIPLLERFGCEVLDLGIISDVPELIAEAFEQAQQQADVVITSGGVSVGEADYTKDILEQKGKIDFWKIAIKPGKPFAFGCLPEAYFCGLPGNPVSAVVTLHILAQPFLAKLSGHTEYSEPAHLTATSLSTFKKRPGRADYQRGIYSVVNGQLQVEGCSNQSSGAFRSMSLANCYIVIEKDRGTVEAGETVSIQPFDHTFY